MLIDNNSQLDEVLSWWYLTLISKTPKRGFSDSLRSSGLPFLKPRRQEAL